MSGFASAELTHGQTNALVKIVGGPDAVRRILRGDLELTLRGVDDDDVKRQVIDVCRDERPSYPETLITVVRPELDLLGPTDYNITKLKEWFGGADTEESLRKIYDRLIRQNLLEKCLGLADGEEIQRRGVHFYLRYLQGNDYDVTKRVYLWRSVARTSDGEEHVPVLYGVHHRSTEVKLSWERLDSLVRPRNHRTLMFP